MVEIAGDKLNKLCVEFGLFFVVLFGSKAKQVKAFKGDFDFAVLSQEPLIGNRELELVNQFSQILNTNEVDVVILNFASPLLQYEVAREAVLLYERTPGAFNDFRSLAIRRWNDNKKFFELRMDYIKDFIKERSVA